MVAIPLAAFFVLSLLATIFGAIFGFGGNEPVLPWLVAGSVVLFVQTSISTVPGILLMVLISEWRKIDSRPFYAGAGGLIFISAALSLIGWPSLNNLGFLLIFLVAGMFGGLLYWAIAWNYEE